MATFTPRPAFDVSLEGDRLTINLHRDFDANGKDHDWVNLIVARFPGPYVEVAVDISQIGPRVNSSFFSGLYRLHQQFGKEHKLRLVGAHERALQGLDILALRDLFEA